MHLVAALDAVPELRPVLALFEGVASGAADGYGRMAGPPAATLLHLGPGLGNAFANLHNAYKARTPMVNLVGDHAVLPRAARRAADDRHRGCRATGLELARHHARRPLRRRRRGRGRGRRPEPRRRDRDAHPAGRRGLVHAPGAAAPVAPQPRAPVAGEAIDRAERALRSGGESAILLGGHTTREPGLRAAARIAAATGARVFHDTFPPRLERGAGRPQAGRSPT